MIITGWVKKSLFLFCMVICSCAGHRTVWAQDALPPSNLVIAGQVQPGNGITPQADDSVGLHVSGDIFEIVEGDRIADSDGSFSIRVERDRSFNNTPLGMTFVQGNDIYELTTDGNEPVEIIYFGGLDPAPVFPINPVVGRKVGNVTDPESDDVAGDGEAGGDEQVTTLSEELQPFDINNDGQFDQNDINAIKAVLGRENPSTHYDVNGDGLVNTRDVILAIKTYQRNFLRASS